METTTYESSPASLFATAAREVKTEWSWCKFCMTRTDHFVDINDMVEVYRCCNCGNENRKGAKP